MRFHSKRQPWINSQKHGLHVGPAAGRRRYPVLALPSIAASSRVLGSYNALGMEREVRYCTTEDGVRIAYCVEGAGPALVMLPSFIESFALDKVFPAYKQFFSDVSMVRTLVRFDARGIGLSQRGVVSLG